MLGSPSFAAGMVPVQVLPDTVHDPAADAHGAAGGGAVAQLVLVSGSQVPLLQVAVAFPYVGAVRSAKLAEVPSARVGAVASQVSPPTVQLNAWPAHDAPGGGVGVGVGVGTDESQVAGVCPKTPHTPVLAQRKFALPVVGSTVSLTTV
ncbi:hypothetical protein E4T66_18010 [Sinimarinibacterium sp. CAU 1509]|uniref:hypothetical protein n=1 Tax=Sinimarinibacterium sp. CAU 1509 TaxID=2562283 RepID=UPI0010AD8CB1|nr:hypothetical protein [Sinimarinibacterium sp. CAU 1509]TJY57301.1 hypothetical protein E4T66_18010 [Sinimarinibacterium sp. CAU 1509]